MKKWILVLIVIVGALAVYYRNRLFVRDPLGSVMRDGVKEDGAQVFLNYSNEVLIVNDTPPIYITVIQHGNHLGTPAKINCLHYLLCLLDADQASLIRAPRVGEVEAMNGREVRYRIGGGLVAVKLR